MAAHMDLDKGKQILEGKNYYIITTVLQPLLNCVRDYPCELVPER